MDVGSKRIAELQLKPKAFGSSSHSAMPESAMPATTIIRDWVELNMTPGIGPRAAAKLLERFGSAEAVYNATRAELESCDCARSDREHHCPRLFARPKPRLSVSATRRRHPLVGRRGLSLIFSEIYDPPIVLYVKGAWSECLEPPLWRGRVTEVFDLRSERRHDAGARPGTARRDGSFGLCARHRCRCASRRA